jgi:hypothetical protein
MGHSDSVILQTNTTKLGPYSPLGRISLTPQMRFRQPPPPRRQDTESNLDNNNDTNNRTKRLVQRLLALATKQGGRRTPTALANLDPIRAVPAKGCCTFVAATSRRRGYQVPGGGAIPGRCLAPKTLDIIHPCFPLPTSFFRRLLLLLG